MNGREFGEALERALEEGPGGMLSRVGMVKAIRAALNAGPQEYTGWPPGIEPGKVYSSQSQEWTVPGKLVERPSNAGPLADTSPSMQPSPARAGSAGGLADDVTWACGIAHLSKSHYERLRAWEKWGREHAAPVLRNIESVHPVMHKSAQLALAAMPKESP